MKSLLLFIALTLFFTYPVGDADLGWHLKYGQYLTEHGTILKTNTFSYQMPDFIWANHSWGYDAIAYLIFAQTGFMGLSLAGGLLVAASLWVLLRDKPLSAIGACIFMWFGRELLTIGLRSQLFSLLATGILWHLLTNHKTHKKRATYSLPILFLVWANLHGEFIVGLGLFALYLTSARKLLPTFLISIAVTLINPFGIHLFTTAISHLNSPILKYIYEWMPWELNTPRMIAFIIYTGAFWILYLRSKKKLRGEELVYLALTFLSLKARRMIPFFLLLSLPQFTQLLEKYIPKKINTVLLIILTVYTLTLLPSRNLATQTWDRYCATNVHCSMGALNYIKTHQLQGKLFNAYGLGGWLIYHYPAMPVFIDGRMTLWQDTSHTYPFQTYFDVVHARPTAQPLFYQLDFDYVLIQPQFELAGVLKDSLHWPILYSDETLILFQNPRLTQMP